MVVKQALCRYSLDTKTINMIEFGQYIYCVWYNRHQNNYGFNDMIIEISALVISGIGDNQSLKNRVMDFTIKLITDASCKLRNSLLKCAVKNFVLWV